MYIFLIYGRIKRDLKKNPVFKNIGLWNKNNFEPGFIQRNCMQMCAFLIRESKSIKPSRWSKTAVPVV